jgi:hypothetical protein
MTTESSTTLEFTDTLGTSIYSTTNLGNGTEQVIIRSNLAGPDSPTQFLRINLAFQ